MGDSLLLSYSAYRRARPLCTEKSRFDRNRQSIGRIGIPLREASGLFFGLRESANQSHLPSISKDGRRGLEVLRLYNAKAYSVSSATSPFVSTTIARRNPTETDVQIEILFCGICHSDLHTARPAWAHI